MQSTKLSGQPIICQLLSFLPKELVTESVAKFDSDKYYKTMSTYKQFVFMLYGIVSKSGSLTSLCKCLLFLEGKLGYVGIDKLPPSSTLSDANCKRNSDVFQDLYYRLFNHYKSELLGGFSCLPINGEVSASKIKRFDSTTFTLFVDVFKGAGRKPEQGIKSQIWIALIANLIFTLIYQRNKQAEAFVTIVSMARAGLNTYVCFLSIIKHEKLSIEDRDNGIVQLKIFENRQGGVFETVNKSP